jgi:imidazolonepropionase-like amidohydrolase
MAAYLFHGGKFLDPRKADLQDGIEVLIEDDRIKEVSDRPIGAAGAIGASRIDLRGRTLMAGLIDAHIHIFLAEVNLALLEGMPLTLLTTKAVVNARNMLMRGFTSVRDTGGCDSGTTVAAETGIMDSPRLFISGMPISQTGGHADFRRRNHTDVECACCSGLSYMSRIADGVPEMIKAVRDELRKGADQIKIMVSGGVASQSDPLESIQFRLDEIEADARPGRGDVHG